MRQFPRYLLPVLFVATCLIASCSVVDRFSGRAVQYNVEVEKFKLQSLVINIVRAGHRLPLQFTDVSTVTGTAQASFTGALKLPLSVSPDTATKSYSFDPTIGFSGGPSFAVASLNTKEFYQGILTPLSVQTLYYYLDAGIPETLLLTLFVSKIEYGPPDALSVVYNDVSSEAKYKKFKDFIDALSKRGIAIEPLESETLVGAPLTDAELKDLKGIASIETAGLKIVSKKVPDDEGSLSEFEKALKQQDVTEYYRIARKKTSYRVCFRHDGQERDLPLPETEFVISASTTCGASQLDGEQSSARAESKLGDISIQSITSIQLKRASTNADDEELEKDQPILRLTTRSVAQVIYYLGEIMRREVNLDGRGSFVPKISSRDDSDDVLFRITDSPEEGEHLNAEYGSTMYYVRIDPSGSDRSTQVMDLVIQLLAQNSSAKDLPAPNVISIIGP